MGAGAVTVVVASRCVIDEVGQHEPELRGERRTTARVESLDDLPQDLDDGLIVGARFGVAVADERSGPQPLGASAELFGQRRLADSRSTRQQDQMRRAGPRNIMGVEKTAHLGSSADETADRPPREGHRRGTLAQGPGVHARTVQEHVLFQSSQLG